MALDPHFAAALDAVKRYGALRGQCDALIKQCDALVTEIVTELEAVIAQDPNPVQRRHWLLGNPFALMGEMTFPPEVLARLDTGRPTPPPAATDPPAAAERRWSIRKETTMTTLIHFLPRPIREGNRGGSTACGRAEAPPWATTTLPEVTCRRCRRSVAYRAAMRPGATRLPSVEEAQAYTGSGR
jgi:hypothetical protein